jgi:hypothetical protein
LVLVAAVLLLGEPAAAVTRAAVLLLGEPAAAVTSISNMSGRTIDDS